MNNYRESRKLSGSGTAPEDLVRVSIEELLTQPTEAFERTVDTVLRKNTELYRRLT